jgi:hypothetical protein
MPSRLAVGGSHQPHQARSQLNDYAPSPASRFAPPRLVLLAVAAVLAPVAPVIATVLAAVAPVVAPVVTVVSPAAPLVHAVGDDHGTADGGHGPSAASV